MADYRNYKLEWPGLSLGLHTRLESVRLLQELNWGSLETGSEKHNVLYYYNLRMSGLSIYPKQGVK